MKAKTTIRKMHHRPVARALAHFQRDLGNMNRRLTRLVELTEALETENRVALRTETELRERLARAEAGAGAMGQPEPAAEAVAFNGGRCVCGHSGAEHGVRGQYCCRINCLCHGFEAAGEAFDA